MIVYTNGCSHTAGHCVKHYQSWPHMVLESLKGDKSFLSFYRKPIVGMEIKKQLLVGDSILFNEAQWGAGNDYILHHTIESINKLISLNKKPDFVFIQWSGTNRRLHSTIYGDEKYINLDDSPELGIKFEPMGSLHTCHYVYILQEFLKMNKISYLFFNYMAWDESVSNSYTFPKIDLDNWVDFDMGKDIIFNGLIDLFKSKNYTCDSAGHPNIEGNHYIAKNILNKLGKEIIPIDSFKQNLL
jgi:hypothetical protein